MQQPTTSQKVLKVFSILAIISGVLTVLAAIVMFAAGATIMNENPQDLQVEGLSGSEVGGLSIGLGILFICLAIFSFLAGYFGLRAAKDNTKVAPVWWVGLIGLVLGVIGFIMTIVNGGGAQEIGSMLGNLVGDAVIFWLANNIKKEAKLA